MFRNRSNLLIIGGVAILVVITGSFIYRRNIPSEESNSVVIETDDGKKYEASVKGSCNLIQRGSTCIEYYGTYWNEETVNMACEEGTYSTKSCPIPHMGGCRIMAGSITDMTTYHYDHGGDPFSEEAIVYASQACNSIPGGAWTEK